MVEDHSNAAAGRPAAGVAGRPDRPLDSQPLQMTRGIRSAALVLIASAALVAFASVGGRGTGEASAARKPSPQTVWLSPSGRDATCARANIAKPCATPGQAWALAQAGDTIQVADGDYTSGCSLSGTKASDVTFTGSAAARFICALAFPSGAVHAVVNGISLYQVSTSGGSYVTIKNLAITCTDSAPYTLYAPGNKCNARFSLTGSASYWTFNNVVIGPTYDSSLCGNSGNTNFAPGLSNSTFTRVTFKDSRYQAACGTGQHTENFYFQGPVSNVTFNACTFSNGPNSGAVTGTGPADGTGPSSTGLLLTGSFTGLTIENCVFVGPRTAIDGTVDATISNSDLINNTLTQGSYFQCDAAHCPGGYPTTFRIINNIGADQQCMIGPAVGSTGGYFRHNLWYYNDTGGSADKCDASDLSENGPGIVNTIFANYANNDYRLLRTSPAVGHGDRTSYSMHDKLGTCRPQGAVPDIGAYEYLVPVRAKPTKTRQGDKKRSRTAVSAKAVGRGCLRQ